MKKQTIILMTIIILQMILNVKFIMQENNNTSLKYTPFIDMQDPIKVGEESQIEIGLKLEELKNVPLIKISNWNNYKLGKLDSLSPNLLSKLKCIYQFDELPMGESNEVLIDATCINEECVVRYDTLMRTFNYTIKPEKKGEYFLFIEMKDSINVENGSMALRFYTVE